MDRPISRILRLAAASIAVVAGTAVWPLASTAPVVQALDNTPWVLPAPPARPEQLAIDDWVRLTNAAGAA